ncbi:MAG: CDP-alcohol phosphatidyltransferase family protein [Planctomycetes bacterium]|nr:CDP-alcohol phosphatidyltransferase family protein [Planctomycetota bacterium]
MTARGLFARAAEIRRASDKPDDFLWARYATRPYAALLLAAVDSPRLTPNALSMVSLVVGLVACAAFAFAPGYAGLWCAWALSQASYTVDCMDGMLARWQGLASPCGTALDFLCDAIKQVALFPAVAYRVWAEAGHPVGPWDGWALWVAIVAGPVVAAGLMTTTFLRSPEVTGESERAHRDAHGKDVKGRVMAGVAFLMNYPSWVIAPVALDRMDVFVGVSVGLYGVYAVWALARVWGKVCGVGGEVGGE